jgi:hypothetical protein
MSTCLSLLKEAAVLRKAIGSVLEIGPIAALDHGRKMQRGNVLSLTKDD